MNDNDLEDDAGTDRDREYSALAGALTAAVETVGKQHELAVGTIVLAHLNGAAKALAAHLKQHPGKREEFTNHSCDLLRSGVDFFLMTRAEEEQRV